jgi:hypothetical protein
MKLTTVEIQEKLKAARDQLYNIAKIWKHYKGGVYRVDDVVFDTAIDDVSILYFRIGGPGFDASLEGDILFARPLNEWFDTIEVDVDGTTHCYQRFIPVKAVQVTEYREITE